MKTVLAIDGGGIRGIIPAVVIQHIEKQVGRPISECFDLITGTSTGGIIACALAAPEQGTSGNPLYKASDIVNFYTNQAPLIFDEKRNLFQRLFKSKYPNENLEDTLRMKLGDYCFSQTITNVMIPTYDIINMRPFFFKSWKSSVNDVPSYKIAAATSSAPTFFDPTRIEFQHCFEPRFYIDGAVAANNPAMCGYVEAKRLWPEEDVFVLSIGTGDYSNPVYKDGKDHWGVTAWLREIIDVIMDAPVDSVDYQLRTLNPDMYVRLQTRINLASKKIDRATDRNVRLLHEEALQLLIDERETIDEVVAMLKERL